jgi:hypothetical protein
MSHLAKLTSTHYMFVVKWTLLWLAITAVPNLILIPHGFDYTDGYAVVSAYYLIAAMAGAHLYRLQDRLRHHTPYQKQILGILVLLLTTFTVSEILKHYWPLDITRANLLQERKFTFPLFAQRNWITKFCEIIFQQTFILGFLKRFREFQVTDRDSIKIFCAAFTILHVPLIMFFGWDAFYFIGPSFFAGLIFSYLILNFRQGPLYSYAVHLSFYLGLGIYWRYL